MDPADQVISLNISKKTKVALTVYDHADNLILNSAHCLVQYLLILYHTTQQQSIHKGGEWVGICTQNHKGGNCASNVKDFQQEDNSTFFLLSRFRLQFSKLKAKRQTLHLVSINSVNVNFNISIFKTSYAKIVGWIAMLIVRRLILIAVRYQNSQV